MKPSYLFALCFVTAAFADDARVTETFSHTYPLAANGSLHLENTNGTVEISGWDKNEVSVEAVKTAPTPEDLARVHIKVETSPDRLTVTSEYDKKWYLVGSWRGEVRYTIRVPFGVKLQDVSAINGDIKVSGVKGPLALKTLNGRIEASDVSSASRFETVNGSIVVQYSKLDSVDSITMRTVNGKCSLTLPKGTAYRLSSKSVNGNVRTDTPVKIEKTGLGQLRASNGEGGPSIEFQSVNGDLAVH
jgi:HSP20 family molecular chaperone IbpA